MNRRLQIALLSFFPALAAAVAVACSESTDGAVPLNIGDATIADTGVAIADDGATPTDGAVVTKPDSSLVFGDAAVLLNEISANDEWVEIVATGTSPIDLSGFKVADSEKDDAGPKIDEAATFPLGTILSPRSYAIVQGGGIDAGVGKPCPDGGQSYCVNAEFGISNKNGEVLYLLDAKGVVVGYAVYPAKAAADGETWGRIPNADPSGAFVVTAPTPGTANVTP